mmetsp:Transcript_49655/g.56233  ORF Transcript_49655/g.56233 Transcript_49655/m.56233 type:complete len:246 (+) Transcript_49655:109-846(+)
MNPVPYSHDNILDVEDIGQGINGMNINIIQAPIVWPVGPVLHEMIPAFSKSTMMWPFLIAEVPLSLTAETGYMLYPNGVEVLADVDRRFTIQFNEDPILQAVLFELGQGITVGNDVFDSAKNTLRRALVTRARFTMALYMAFYSNLKNAHTNGEEGKFASIVIDRWTVQEEMEITRNILLKYQKVMSPYLDEYVRVISPLDFEYEVNILAGKKQVDDDESDTATVGSDDDYESEGDYHTDNDGRR